MREIKFRAWDSINNRMLEDKDYTVNAVSFDGLPIRCFTDSCQSPVDYLENVILMQYTGLKDKNGIEIYEGDVLHQRYEDAAEEIGYCDVYLEVAFKDGAFGWIGDITGQHHPFAEQQLDGYEVSGNIYQNPELLKEPVA